MRLSHASLLLTGVTTAFAQHMPRYLDQFVERDEPFQAPRQDSPVPVQYIDHPCEYNSDYDSTILPQERINAESISTQPIVIKLPGKWARRNSCMRWSVPNVYEGKPGPYNGNPIECCVDLACSSYESFSCREYDISEDGCTDGVDPTECAAQLGLSRFGVKCCIGEKYKRVGDENGNQDEISQMGDGIWDPSIFSASNDQDLFNLADNDQGGLGAFSSAEQYPNGFTTETDGFGTLSLLPSDGPLGDFESVAFSLPEVANPDVSIFSDSDRTDNKALLSELALGASHAENGAVAEKGKEDVALFPE